MIQKDRVVDIRPPHSCSTQPRPVPLCCIDANGGPITDSICDHGKLYMLAVIAERISARHLILEYGLFERIYVCMSVTLRNAIINAYAHAYVHSIGVRSLD